MTNVATQTSSLYMHPCSLSGAKEAIARARPTPSRAIQLAGAGRGLGNKRPSAARTSSKQQQQAIKLDSSSTPTPHSCLPSLPVLYEGRAMFLALAIAVVLCGAESSLAPSRERAARLNKREQGKFIEEGPGQCPFTGMVYFDASKGACAPCVSFCNDPFPASCDMCLSRCSCPFGKVVDLRLKACVKPDRCPKARDQDCKLANGKEIKNGTEEFFFSNGSCSTCACIEGRSLCMSERCNSLACPEQDWIFLPGLCCPVCPIIEEEPTDQVELHCQMDTEDGTVQLLNGASYTQPCASCFCDRGVLRCLRTTCPKTVCRLGQELVTPQGECCPKCVHPTLLPALCVLEGGQVMIEGETRRQEADPCITCTCMPNGSAQCFSESCSVPCPFGEKPVWQDGQCCPTCQKTKSP